MIDRMHPPIVEGKLSPLQSNFHLKRDPEGQFWVLGHIRRFAGVPVADEMPIHEVNEKSRRQEQQTYSGNVASRDRNSMLTHCSWRNWLNTSLVSVFFLML
jgi:hypothetical protein